MDNIPIIDMIATGMNITRLRINAGLTVRDLQNIFGFSTPQAIYKWQRGDAMPTLDNMLVLAAVFGVAISCKNIQVICAISIMGIPGNEKTAGGGNTSAVHKDLIYSLYLC